jgi:hypothetical protein
MGTLLEDEERPHRSEERPIRGSRGHSSKDEERPQKQKKRERILRSAPVSG